MYIITAYKTRKVNKIYLQTQYIVLQQNKSVYYTYKVNQQPKKNSQKCLYIMCKYEMQVNGWTGNGETRLQLPSVIQEHKFRSYKSVEQNEIRSSPVYTRLS